MGAAMLAIACPRCGRPAAANLAAPELLCCPACGFRGPPPADAYQKLTAARHMLFGLDVRLRQLGDAQRRSLETARSKRRVFLFVTAFFAFPFTLWALASLGSQLDPVDPADQTSPEGIFFAVGPLAIFALGASLSYRVIKDRQQRLEGACAARPPRARGEPAACHVCGAPLHSAAGMAVVRCGFCQADNLVEPSVLSRLNRADVRAAGQLEAEVQTQASAMSREAGLANALLLPMTLAAPVLMLVALFGIGIPLMFIDKEPNLAIRYVGVPVAEAGTCVARLRQRREGARLDFGESPPPSVPSGQPPPPELARATFDVKALEGRIVRSKEGKPARVVRSFQQLVMALDNHVEIEPVGGGPRQAREVRGICFVDAKGAKPGKP
jgi:LSD1 subclass zinc finger protein